MKLSNLRIEKENTRAVYNHITLILKKRHIYWIFNSSAVSNKRCLKWAYDPDENTEEQKHYKYK